jgi:hypothetical protein
MSLHLAITIGDCVSEKNLIITVLEFVVKAETIIRNAKFIGDDKNGVTYYLLL